MIHDVDVPWLHEARYDSPYFEIIFVYIMYIAFILILCYLSYDGMFFVVMLHACLKMRLIGCMISKAFEDVQNVKEARRNIARVVEEQCSVFR